MRLINLLFLAAAILTASSCTVQNSATTQAPAVAPVVTEVVPMQSVALEKACPAPGTYQAVDASMPFNQAALFAMRKLGVGTVIRYYEYGTTKPPATIAGKEPTTAELKLIAANGLNFLGVFQHNNSSLSTFTSTRGTADANRVLALASEWHQPKDSAAYFGVDNDWPDAGSQAMVKAYFVAASPIIRKAGFKVGVYGSGQVCKAIRDVAKLADYCWISDATAHTGTADYKKAGTQNMVQFLPTDCGGKNGSTQMNVDFNKVYTADFGQWKVTL